MLGLPRNPETPLIGRSAELAELLLTLARGAKGEGSLVTLEGEAGIGKTFLLEQALSKAEALGFRCFAGGAEELERHRPFGAISEALGIEDARGHFLLDAPYRRLVSAADSNAFGAFGTLHKQTSLRHA